MLNFKKQKFCFWHYRRCRIGCGATLARCLEDEASVHVAAFSTARQSLPEGMEVDTLKKEFYAAMGHYDIPNDHLHLFDFQVRRLHDKRQEVLDQLVDLKNKIDPDIIFTPSSNDQHQDHQVVNRETLRAFKSKTILGYELPWNNLEFASDIFFSLERRHIDKKIRALQEYNSQIIKNRSYFNNDFILGLAKVRGVQKNTKYAEAFEVITALV